MTDHDGRARRRLVVAGAVVALLVVIAGAVTIIVTGVGRRPADSIPPVAFDHVVPLDAPIARGPARVLWNDPDASRVAATVGDVVVVWEQGALVGLDQQGRHLWSRVFDEVPGQGSIDVDTVNEVAGADDVLLLQGQSRESYQGGVAAISVSDGSTVWTARGELAGYTDDGLAIAPLAPPPVETVEVVEPATGATVRREVPRSEVVAPFASQPQPFEKFTVDGRDYLQSAGFWRFYEQSPPAAGSATLRYTPGAVPVDGGLYVLDGTTSSSTTGTVTTDVASYTLGYYPRGARAPSWVTPVSEKQHVRRRPDEQWGHLYPPEVTAAPGLALVSDGRGVTAYG